MPDRILVNSGLIVACFLSVLLLTSQSAASYPTYLLALAMLVTFPKWNDVFAEPFGVSVLLLISYLCLSAFWSTPFAVDEVVSIAVRGLLVFLFVVALAECQLRGQVQRWLAKTLGVCGALVVVAASVNFMLTDPEDGRLNGLGQLDTHVVAALVYATVVVFLLKILLEEQTLAWRVFAVAAIGLCIVAVYFSDSRNAWVSLLSGMSIYLLAHFVRDRQRFVVGAAVLAVFFLIIFGLGLLDPQLRELLLPRGDSFRLQIWSAAFERIQDSWLIGFGIATPDAIFIGADEFQHPHNMYLAVLFQGGIIGLLLLLLVLVYTLRSLFEHYHVADAKLALGLLAIALPSYVLDGHELVDKVGETWFLFWLPVGLSLGLRWASPQVDR